MEDTTLYKERNVNNKINVIMSEEHKARGQPRCGGNRAESESHYTAPSPINANPPC